ncbi:DM13 domain-containing protein [Arthrobacter sp. KN11-1C]|uniref:DM13 domain-containing protein n=1 Tax=Arthrobacter sp. KN11-1C TaxID=3445774 RepID=UPI003FA18B9A
MVKRDYRPDTANLIGRILMAAAVTVTAAGCTYVAPEAPSGTSTNAVSGASTPQAAPTSVSASWDAPLTGRFISQGTRTVGVVHIAETEAGATLTLENFSIAPNPDLKVILNEGALSKDTSGDMVVEDPKFLDIGGRLQPGPGSQTFNLPPSPPFRIRSVTIMDSRTGVAYGTADLTPGSAVK